MHIDIADPTPEQGVLLDKVQDLRVGGDARARQTR
jgi:hypothetical protein